MKCLVLVALAWCAAGVASAQEDARGRFAAGQALVAEGRFEEAYAAFEAGHALSDRPLFLFNMAECALHAGRQSDARRDYERYVAAAPEGSMAQTARERLAELAPAPPPLPVVAAD